MKRMHADELEIDDALVRGLLARHFPRWSGLPLARVEPAGTDNAIFRLGDDLAVRLPRTKGAATRVPKEHRWLPQLAPRLPLAVPVPLALAPPDAAFPWPWLVCAWVDGEDATLAPPGDERAAAEALAGFVQALASVDAAGGPGPGVHNAFRGVPLAERDEGTRRALALLGDRVDAAAVSEAWEAALAAPAWNGQPVWIHGDLDLRNLLTTGGRISGVVDFGCLGVGDPACDVMAAWKIGGRAARERFRELLGVDDATWERGRGWALSQALMALSYYTPETNAVLVTEAERWLHQVLGA